jgi:hypothetical protein
MVQSVGGNVKNNIKLYGVMTKKKTWMIRIKLLKILQLISRARFQPISDVQRAKSHLPVRSWHKPLISQDPM